MPTGLAVVAFETDMDAQESKQRNAASEKLAEIAAEISGCHKCPLAATRTHTVPGEGSPTAEIMFVGEGPGREEDETGKPFVGRAGRFLDELIESLPMRREDVFIANVVKCRPPGNRDPERQEVETCSGYLTEQIETIDPLVVVPLGRHALGWFVSNPRITADHGKIMPHGNRVLMPLLHPSAGLRNPENARRLRESIHTIRDALLESMRLRRDASTQEEDTRQVEIPQPVAEIEEPLTSAAEESATTTIVQSETKTAENAVGLFERPQTDDEVQAELKRQRAMEAAAAAAENQLEKVVTDDRQTSLF